MYQTLGPFWRAVLDISCGRFVYTIWAVLVWAVLVDTGRFGAWSAWAVLVWAVLVDTGRFGAWSAWAVLAMGRFRPFPMQRRATQRLERH